MRKFLYWLLAVVITIALSVYQRMTGPTHPQKVAVELNGTSYQLKLPRSGVQRDEMLKLKDIPQSTLAQLHYRQYPTNNAYTTVDFEWKDNQWQASLPVQPVGGKLQYYIPAGILVPHILLMFAAMLFAVYTLMLVLTRKKYSRWLKITVATLFVGGFIFGPLVQHAAFGPWWTGFPYGTDMTDNKTLLSFLFFLVALATLKWKHNKWVVSLAVLFMIAIFSIPHSAYGSEYDYEKQQLSTEKIAD